MSHRIPRRHTTIPTQQLLVRLPEDLARRPKRHVPPRSRSAFVQHLLEQALPPDDGENDPLYQAALDVERDARLTAEMAEWDVVVGDLGRILAKAGSATPIPGDELPEGWPDKTA